MEPDTTWDHLHCQVCLQDEPCRDQWEELTLEAQIPIYWVPVLKPLNKGLGLGFRGLGFRVPVRKSLYKG